MTHKFQRNISKVTIHISIIILILSKTCRFSVYTSWRKLILHVQVWSFPVHSMTYMVQIHSKRQRCCSRHYYTFGDLLKFSEFFSTMNHPSTTCKGRSYSPKPCCNPKQPDFGYVCCMAPIAKPTVSPVKPTWPTTNPDWNTQKDILEARAILYSWLLPIPLHDKQITKNTKLSVGDPGIPHAKRPNMLTAVFQQTTSSLVSHGYRI